MTTPRRRLPSVLLVLAVVTTAAAPAAQGQPAPRGEVMVGPDGTKTQGRLEGDRAGGFRFAAAGKGGTRPLPTGTVIVCEGRGPSAAAGVPPFSVELGRGQRLSGRLAGLTQDEVRLTDVTGEGQLTVVRGGVHALVQRPGESQVFQDGFESLDVARWSVVGEPDLVTGPKLAGSKSLSLPAGGASLTRKVDEPFGSGRLDVAFRDNGTVEAGQQWFIDLTFRGGTGPQTVRVVLGWAEESLAVESPGGPALAVQRLARTPGWHRLAVRFGPDLCEVGVDGNELAHGKGFGGPLVEVRLASFQSGKDEPPEGLAGELDDLRLVRFDAPAADVETDIAQDEIRLTAGDQLFGKVRGADADGVEISVDGRDVTLPWGEVSGVHFRRAALAGSPVEGLLVRAEWRASAGTDPRDVNLIEGALVGLSAAELTLETPYAGAVVVPRPRLTTLRVLGRGRRLVLDPMAHHLGDEFSTTEPVLDPPQPEGGVLERAVDLAEVPAGGAFLVLDVVQVVGEATDLPFSTLVKKGELRTNVKINGEPFDYLNRYVTSKNETPERIRLPIPRGLLKPGKNVVRLEQAGIASDPNYLDDLGVLEVALEFTPAAARRSP